MSQSRSSETYKHNDSSAINRSLLSNLRQFRFQKNQPKIVKMSDEDSHLLSPVRPPRRKTVNRIEDSDSDTDGPSKPFASKAVVDVRTNEEKSLKYMTSLYPHKDTSFIRDVLKKTNWNTEEAKKVLGSTYKRKLMDPEEINPQKQRKIEVIDILDTDSDEANYKNEVNPSDSDSLSDTETSDDTSANKKAILEFMQNAQHSELCLIPQCSAKKAKAIIDARPFGHWTDLIKKFEKYQYLDTDIINSAQVLLQTRNVLGNLMKKCLRLSANIEKAVAAGASMIKYQPKGLSSNLTLAPYQLVGLNWLAVLHDQNVNGILADEMGLGKTIQVISFLTYLKEVGCAEDKDKPHVIIVPGSTIDNWANELAKWSPSLAVMQYHGLPAERKALRSQWRNGELKGIDVFLTSYTMVSSTPQDRRFFRDMPIHYVVIDEAHMLKNMNTQRYEYLVKINAKHRILMTGTPLQNNLLELVSLLIFVMPSMFAGKEDDLKSLFSKYSKNPTAAEDNEQTTFGKEQVKNAKQIMQPFILRRLKSDVADLPKKTDKVIRCRLTQRQQRMYDQLVANITAKAREPGILFGVSIMMHLRKAANHPLLQQSYYEKSKLKEIAPRLCILKGTTQDKLYEELTYMSDFEIHQEVKLDKHLARYALPQELITDSGKLRKLDKLLPRLKDGGHRALIFSQFTMVLDILEEYLTIRGHKFLRMDGKVPVKERQSMIDKYTEDDSIFIFLLSTRAGGLGINLTKADTVIIHDLDFNPYNDKQAEDRCHRIGQKRPVTIVRLLGEGTIEETMYEMALEKLHLEQQVTANETKDKKNVLKLLQTTLGLDLENTALELDDRPPREKDAPFCLTNYFQL